WDWHHPDHPLKDQYVLLTVPASFGEDARRLTLKAAAMAGVPVVRLREEPTAAFYAWFWEHREHFAQMQGEKRVLVCDVGGGTSDFTLLKVSARPGDVPQVERVGVGDHLLLGGDNMDLAIAWKAEASMGGRLSPQGLLQLAEESRRAKEACLGDVAPEELSITLLGGGSNLIGGSRTARLVRGGNYRGLAHGWEAEASMGGRPSPQGLLELAGESRRAKEACLGDVAPEELSITLLGSGSKLIGGSRTARLATSEVRSFLLESFFPRLEWNAELAHMSSALVEAGLPYEKDPAITRHILRFLRQYQSHHPEQEQGFPDAVLFNGGPFNSGLLRRHLMEIFQGWRSGPVEELNIPSP